VRYKALKHPHFEVHALILYVPCSSCTIDTPGPFSLVISATRVLGLLKIVIDGNIV
jgi:hypothetical protein